MSLFVMVEMAIRHNCSPAFPQYNLSFVLTYRRRLTSCDRSITEEKMVVIHLNTDMQTQADMKTGQLNGRIPKKQWADVYRSGIDKCSIHQHPAVSSVSSTGQFRWQNPLIRLTSWIVRERGEYINPLRHIVLIICCETKYCNLKEDISRVFAQEYPVNFLLFAM